MRALAIQTSRSRVTARARKVNYHGYSLLKHLILQRVFLRPLKLKLAELTGNLLADVLFIVK